MTYATLKSIINAEFAEFCETYLERQILAADEKYSRRELYFAKTIYNVLMNQDGDETLDTITKEDIQNNIRLFNKVTHSTIQIEYT